MNVTKGHFGKTASEEQTHDTVPDGYSGNVYSCPMHPEVRSTEEGSCPKCGMFLVPEGEVAEHGQHDPSGHTPAQDAASVDLKDGEYNTVPDDYTGTIYTCPMHSQVHHPGPGSCPICGMGLEPETVSLEDEGPNPELIDFTHRFWVGAVLTVPLLVLAMGPFVGFVFFKDLLGERTMLWLEFALATPVILWSGWPFFIRGYQSFRTMNLNMFSLISMGVGLPGAGNHDRVECE